MNTHLLTEITEAPNMNMLWATLIVEECVRSGVTMFCISSGSRSTPLVAAVARHPKAETIVCLDERGAAFYALGYARATRKPAALICTSGTAVANYLPAIVEAFQDTVPMLVLTADRPPELRETGANQTVPQPSMFGEFVRWKFDIPCPDEAITPAVVLTTIDHAVFRTTNAPAGAVHLNCMFREPLAPTKAAFSQNSSSNFSAEYTKPLETWLQSSRPWTRYAPTIPTISTEVVNELAEILASASSPLLCVGRLASAAEAVAVARFASETGLPIIADIASGLRLGAFRHHSGGETTFLPYFDHVLLTPELLDSAKPDVVLHIGGSFVSKRLLQWLGAVRPREFIVVNETPVRLDPNHQVTMRIQADISSFALAAGFALHVREDAQPPQSGTIAHLAITHVTALSEIVQKTLSEAVENAAQQNEPISEIALAHTVSSRIPYGHGLFLSNSMPIRDMDMYAAAHRTDAYLPVGTNRGASGIDGIIATASGFARGLGEPVTLVIGDVALIHDINSLLLAAKNPVPLVIIAINNAGGGIFSFLPIAAHTDIFEHFWGTPHNADFKAAAAFAGLEYILAERTQDFRRAYDTALAAARGKKTSTLIEVRTERTANFDEHKHLQALIASRLREYQA
jgi:2-succinyl-5-enolpyruvyl-6-hydroxy-3-cyclohexene-1-carboxylate synthase